MNKSTEKPKWRGMFPATLNPYDENDRIEEDLLVGQIEFIINAGAGGIPVPMMVNEFQYLSESERKLLIRLTLSTVNGRVPVIANCGAVNKNLAVEYARFSEEHGADGIVAMPPYVSKPPWERILDYYRALNEATRLPIMVQNHPTCPLTHDQVVRLCNELERVSWVQEENGGPALVSKLIDRKCSAIEGVMGGGGAVNIITEQKRGMDGNICACQFADLLQRIWDLLDDKQEAEAQELYNHVQEALRFEQVYGGIYSREILRRRGLPRNLRARTYWHESVFTPSDIREIDRVWESVQPYLH